MRALLIALVATAAARPTATARAVPGICSARQSSRAVLGGATRADDLPQMVAALRGGAAKVKAVKASRLFVSPRRLIGILCVPILAFLLHALVVAVKTSRRPTSTATHDPPQHFFPASPPFWHRLGQLVALAGDDADGAAASHSVEARQEAARALVGNYQQMVNDCCGSEPPPTQQALVRVPKALQCYADEALREAVRRLLGWRDGVKELTETLEPSSAEQAAAWSAVGTYLSARVQAAAEEVPGRAPDMSAAAAAAMRAVLAEVCAARAEPEATAEQPNPTASAPAPRASAPAPRAP